MKTPTLTAPQFALQHAARQLNGTENALGWAKADLAHRAQADGVPEWYVICAAEFGCDKRYCFALAKTAGFYDDVSTETGWPRDALQFSAWAAGAAYWRRKGIELDTLIEVMDEAIAERVSVAEFERKLFETFGEKDPKSYTAQVVAYSKNLFSWAERLGESHPHYAPLMQAAGLLKGIQKGETK